MRPWLPHLIATLLLVSAYRIGPKAAVGNLSDIRQSLAVIAVYQLAAPLVALVVLAGLGVLSTPAGLAIVLVLAAPSVTGAPNFTIMMKEDPTAPMRLLLVGTAVFPLTVIPVFWALPAIPTIGGVMEGALRLLIVIALAVGLAFFLRTRHEPTDEQRAALDGVAAILLGVVVVGLMAAVGPTLEDAPLLLAAWLGFVLVLNFGLQFVAHRFVPVPEPDRCGTAIVAGNRNIALFLVALPEHLVAELLIFIGCYQVPMYLTPILMRKWLARRA